MADSLRLRIKHRTVYRYAEPVAYGLQQLRLTPKSRLGQSVLTWQTQIEGGQRELEFDDQHANRVMLISFSGEGHEITVTSEGEVETMDRAGVIGKQAGFAPLWYFERPTALTKPGAGIRSLIKGLATEETDPIARMHALSARVLERMPYEKGTTTSEHPAEEALGLETGVCQDHAHVFITAARAMGVPARYVSGYLLLDGTVSQEAGHAWAEVHIDPLGWIGFDVSNEVCPDARYVRVATGLDAREAAPVRGMHFGRQIGEELSVEIEVQKQ